MTVGISQGYTSSCVGALAPVLWCLGRWPCGHCMGRNIASRPGEAAFSLLGALPILHSPQRLLVFFRVVTCCNSLAPTSCLPSKTALADCALGSYGLSSSVWPQPSLRCLVTGNGETLSRVSIFASLPVAVLGCLSLSLIQ